MKNSLNIPENYTRYYTIALLIEEKSTTEDIRKRRILNDLAELCGFTGRWVRCLSQHERGNAISYENIHRIAKYFEIDPTLLFTSNCRSTVS